MVDKEISVVFYQRRFSRDDWTYEVDAAAMEEFLMALTAELAPFGICLRYLRDESSTIEVKGYGDLLNSIRIRSPKDHITNLCLGHIIGCSAHRDLFEDLRRGVNRVAFAPETVEPQDGNKIVCHNCGCGC